MQTISVKTLSNAIAGYQQYIEPYKSSHEDSLNTMLELLPHGSGIDAGIKLNEEKTSPEKIVFDFGFHHMDENGYYDGWTNHTIVITPSLQHGFNLRITGKDRNDIKNYLYYLLSDVFTD